MTTEHPLVCERLIQHPYPGDTWVAQGYEFDVGKVMLWRDAQNQLRWDVTLVNPRRIEQEVRDAE